MQPVLNSHLYFHFLIIGNLRCTYVFSDLFPPRRSVPTEECIVEESPVKPVEGILLTTVFIVFPHKTYLSI